MRHKPEEFPFTSCCPQPAYCLIYLTFKKKKTHVRNIDSHIRLSISLNPYIYSCINQSIFSLLLSGFTNCLWYTFIHFQLYPFSSRNHIFCLFTLTLSSIFRSFCLGSVLSADWLVVLLLTVAHIPAQCIKARSVLELPMTGCKVKSQFYISVKTSARSLLPKSTSFRSRGFVHSLCCMLMHMF